MGQCSRLRVPLLRIITRDFRTGTPAPLTCVNAIYRQLWPSALKTQSRRCRDLKHRTLFWSGTPYFTGTEKGWSFSPSETTRSVRGLVPVFFAL
jgi:hypothetical protein